MIAMSQVCTIVPPYLLQRLAGTPEPAAGEGRTARFTSSVADHASRTLRHDTAVRAARVRRLPPGSGATGLTRTISDARGTQILPGSKVRAEGAAVTGDAATDEAYAGLGDTYGCFRTHPKDPQ